MSTHLLAVAAAACSRDATLKCFCFVVVLHSHIHSNYSLNSVCVCVFCSFNQRSNSWGVIRVILVTDFCYVLANTLMNNVCVCVLAIVYFPITVCECVFICFEQTSSGL